MWASTCLGSLIAIAVSAMSPIPETLPPTADAAAPVELDLRWDTPVECGTADEFGALLQSLVERSLALRRGAPLRVEIRITPAETTYVLALYVTDPAGVLERHEQHAACRPLVEFASVLVGTRVLTNPPAIGEPPPRTAPSPPEPTPSVEPTSRRLAGSPPATPDGSWPGPTERVVDPDDGERRRSALAQPRRDVVGVFGAEVGPSFFATPGVSGLVSASGGVWLPFVAVEGYGLYALPRASTPVDGVSARIDLWGGGLRACGRPMIRSWALLACAGIVAGIARAEGRGTWVTPDPRSSHPWLAVPVEVGFVWPTTGRISLRVSSGVSWSAIRPRFHARFGAADREIWASRAISGSLRIGLEVRVGRFSPGRGRVRRADPVTSLAQGGA